MITMRIIHHPYEKYAVLMFVSLDISYSSLLPSAITCKAAVLFSVIFDFVAPFFIRCSSSCLVNKMCVRFGSSEPEKHQTSTKLI